MSSDEESVEAVFEYGAKDAVLAGIWVFFQNRAMRFLYAAVALGAFMGVVAFSAWQSQRKLPVARRSQRYVFSPSGVHVRSGLGESTLSWEAYAKAVETTSVFFLAPQARLWSPIPKRGFRSEADVDRARAVIAEALGKRAKLRKPRA